MVFKRYHFQVLLRLVLIVANCLAVIYVWQLRDYWISFYNLVGLLVLQVYLLFRYLTRWQNDVRVFANSVHHGDYNIGYLLVDKDDAHYELYQMLNSIAAYVRSLQSQFVQQNQYFEYLVKNAQVGLMAYEENGKVLLSNEEALALLGTRPLKNLSHLADTNRKLHEQLLSLSLNQPKLIRGGADKTMRLSARLSKIVIDGKSIYLLSLININPELAENELHSWQDLISVLTHEIMNSVTPIHSLAGSMSKYLDRIDGNDEIVSKAKHSLDVMTRRSQSLMSFVDRYRTISTVPLPRLETVNLGKLISDVLSLMQNELREITLEFSYQPIILKADPSLIEQVLINIVKNALAAVAESKTKKVQIETTAEEKFVVIAVTDSGKGIADNVMDKVFIPFFTTRENGSGIGLTLSRQIMHRHGGTIDITTSPGLGATVILRLPLS